MLVFLYTGETRVNKVRLDSFLALARDLGVRGLAQHDGTGVTQTEPEPIYEEIGVIKTETQNLHQEDQNFDEYLNDSTESPVFETEHTELKVQTRPNQSPVWKYAKKTESGRIQCNFCGIKYNMKDGTTSSIRNHLMKHHSDIPEVALDFSGKKLNLLKKKQTNSPVWKYSRKTTKDKTKCLLCGKSVWSIKGSTSGIRSHLLSCHSDNQDVVYDIPATVTKKCPLPGGEKMQGFRMKNFIKKINSKVCVCLLCENLLDNTFSLKYSHLVEEHSEHEGVEKGLRYFEKKLNEKRRKLVEKPKHSSIWKYYSQDPQNLYAKCQLCPCKVFQIGEGVWEDLANHLYTKHSEELAENEN